MTFSNGTLINAAALNGGAMVLLDSQAPTSAQSSISLSVPAGFSRLKVFWRCRSAFSATGVQLYVQLNGDSGGNYLWQLVQGNNSSAAALSSGTAVDEMQLGTIAAASASSGYFSSGEFTIDGASDTGNGKTLVGTGAAFSSVSNSWAGTYAGFWSGLASVNSITIFGGSGGDLVAASTASVWGLAA